MNSATFPTNDLQLIPPTADLEIEFMAMVQEFRSAGETRFDSEPGLEQDDFPAYLKFLEKGAQGLALDGLVPWSSFWLLHAESRQILGVSSIRHTLSDYLLSYGGHIGYAIRPTQRRLGYGNKILDLSVREARKLQINPILIVCHDDNSPSRKIIEKHGGQLENQVIAENGKPLLRFCLI